MLVPYVPDMLMKEAFRIIHSDTTAGHQGFERTYKLFQKNFFNLKESELIKSRIEKCEACIKAKSTPSMVPLKMYPIPNRPFDTISTDILGPLPITSNNNKFILVVRDVVTRYTIATALENKEADSIIKAFRHTIANYGPSRVCISDNGREFVNDKFKNFLKYYNTKK